MPEASENQSESQKKQKFDPKLPPDKSNPEDVYNFVAKRISGPAFRNPLKNFIDENTFEQGELFKELNQLLENLLQEVLEDGQLTQEDFLQAAEKGITDPKYKKYFNQVINFGDYNFFKTIMTKRNYQIIKMAEQQMANAQKMAEEGQEQNKEEENYNNEQRTKELVAKLLEEEKKEYDEAIKQSLEEEDKRRRIAAIEEEELRRALKNSLMVQEKQKEEPDIKKDEPKKDEPKKEEPKKEPQKKIVPNVISSVSNFQFEGLSKPEKNEKPPQETKPEIKPEIKKSNPLPQNKFVLQSSNLSIQIQSNPYNQSQVQSKPEPESLQKIENNKEEVKKEIKPKEEPKNEIKPEIEEKNDIIQKEEPKGDIKDNNEEIKPKKEERITRDFINVFDEKKKTLKPLGNINKGPNKPSLLQDLQKKKGNIKDDIERIKIKNEKQKNETALDIIKQSIEKDKDKQNNNDIVNLEDDVGGLLINDDNDEEENKNEYVSKHKIEFGKIEIPNNFNGKIPEYTKEKQEELKDFRNMVIKNKINERQNDFDDEI